MKTKTKSSSINIVIENNLFSKNKECKKKECEEPVDDKKGGRKQPSLQYVAPFAPEPSFMSDIRQAFNDKNMYGSRYNSQPPQMYNPQGQPTFNTYYGDHSKQFQQQEDYEDDEDDEEVEPEEVEPEEIESEEVEPEEQPQQRIFDENGKYLLPSNTPAEKKRRRELIKQRANHMSGSKKPQRRTIIKFGLGSYFN